MHIEWRKKIRRLTDREKHQAMTVIAIDYMLTTFILGHLAR
ncbi:MAG: hypothetical protein P8013_10695 [Candidatus Sulfobium sp.]